MNMGIEQNKAGADLEAGNEVIYQNRVYIVEAIDGDEITIFAPESSHEITASALKGGHSHADLAKEYGGILQGEPYRATSPDGEDFMSQKIVFPEDRKQVKSSELEKR